MTRPKSYIVTTVGEYAVQQSRDEVLKLIEDAKSGRGMVNVTAALGGHMHHADETGISFLAESIVGVKEAGR